MEPATPLEEIGKCDDDSAIGLAHLWCFHSTRRKFGVPRDLPIDMRFEFENLLDMGFSAKQLRTEILRKGRDRSEQMWQFRERLKLLKFGDPKKFGQSETAEDRHARYAREARERQAKREKEQREQKPVTPEQWDKLRRKFGKGA